MNADAADLPLVSVYVATRDRAAMARRAVDSVLAQSYPRVELIVSDDGSTGPGYAELAEHVTASGGRYLRADVAAGACAARNRAIEAAAGSLVTGLDDDDEFLPSRVADLVRAFSPDVSLVATGYLERGARAEARRNFDHGAVTLEGMLHYNRIGNQALVLASRLHAVGGFDERLPAMQDHDLWVRLIARFGAARKLPECTYVLHTAHEGERISSSRDRFDEALRLFGDKHAPLLRRRHRKSHELLRKRAHGEPLGARELLASINPWNYKLALSYFRDQTGGARLRAAP